MGDQANGNCVWRSRWARILDTRDPVNVGLNGPFVSAIGQDLQVTGLIATTGGPATVVPTGATGVILDVTVIGPTASGFLSHAVLTSSRTLRSRCGWCAIGSQAAVA